MNFRSALLDKWPYKLAAVVLSILLWLNVTADQERQDHPIPTRVEFEVSDTAWALREAPSEVRTRFQGRQGDLIAMVQPVLRKVIDPVTDSIMQVELTVDDVSFDRSLSVRPTSVVPQRVTVHLERRVDRRVPVVARAGARAAEGFVISRTVVQPDSVTLYGPRTVLDRVLQVETAPLQLGELRASTSRQTDLVLPADLAWIDIVPGTALVSIEVDSLIARRLQVTVRAVGAGADAVTLEPGRVWVTVTGAASAVGSLTAADLVATVRVDVVPAEERTFEVGVQLPAGLSATRAVEPPRVRARRIPGDEDGGRAPATDGAGGPSDPGGAGSLLKNYGGPRADPLSRVPLSRGSGEERRRDVAALRRGGETMDQPRDPPAPIDGVDVVDGHAGSGRHGPISGPAVAGTPGARRSSYGYSFRPTCGGCPPPRIWGRGDRNATHRSSSTGF